MRRLPLLDSLRGFALLLMLVQHFAFDLNHTGAASVNLKDPFWLMIRTVILVLFLGLTGMGFSLGRPSYESWNFQKRLLQLAGCAAVISAATRVLFPDAWVYFGVLHLIFFASLLSPLLRRAPMACLIAGALILVLPLFVQSPAMDGNLLAISGLSAARPHTVDFDPLCPWLGLILIGVYLGSLLRERSYPVFSRELPWLSALGRHTLIFYMTHQAVLLPAAWLLASWKR